MASLYGGADVDTASLVTSDELGHYSRQHDAREPKEMYVIPGDEFSRERNTNHHKPSTIRTGNIGSTNRQMSNATYLRPMMRWSASRFYESAETESLNMNLFDPTQRRNTLQRSKIVQSRRIPNWVWRVITAVLGVPVSRRSHVWISTLIYILTLLFAFTFTVFGIWYTVYDIASENTSTTMHIGFVSLFIGFGWLCLGIYSHRLAGRLFENKNFAASVRIHSRTVFKVSAAALLVVCGLGFTGLNLYRAFPTYAADTCQTIELFSVVCNMMYIARFCFTLTSTLWNLLVGCILLSVCRTHVVGIRLFMRDLEDDAHLYELYWREKIRRAQAGEFNPDTVSILNNREWFVWDEHLSELDPPQEESSGRQTSTNTKTGPQRRGENSMRVRTSQNRDDNVFTSSAPEVQAGIASGQSADIDVGNRDDDEEEEEELPENPPVMTNDELLLCYWKISDRMRMTSDCLQRWLASWISFVVIWCGDYVIYWLSHKPDVVGILEFTLPVLLLLVLCSAYAEANGEGQKMIRCICPTKERFGLLNFLNEQPLQMQTFGLSITYAAMLTVILAFAVAFSSRLILDEVMKV